MKIKINIQQCIFCYVHLTTCYLEGTMKSGVFLGSCLGWRGYWYCPALPFCVFGGPQHSHTQRKIQGYYSLSSHTLGVSFDDAALYCSESVYSSPNPYKRKIVYFCYVFLIPASDFTISIFCKSLTAVILAL